MVPDDGSDREPDVASGSEDEGQGSSVGLCRLMVPPHVRLRTSTDPTTLTTVSAGVAKIKRYFEVN